MEIIINTKLISYYKYMKANRNRRYVSKEGQDIINLVKQKKEELDIKTFSTEVEVNYQLFFRTNYKRRDLDNCAKVLNDCLEKSDILLNDNLIKRMIMEKTKSDTEYAIITITPIT